MAPCAWKGAHAAARAHLDGDAADGPDGLARELLVGVVDVFGELRRDLVRVGLVRDGRQDLQLERSLCSSARSARQKKVA